MPSPTWNQNQPLYWLCKGICIAGYAGYVGSADMIDIVDVDDAGIAAAVAPSATS